MQKEGVTIEVSFLVSLWMYENLLFRASCLGKKVKLVLHFVYIQWKKETWRIGKFGEYYSGKGVFSISVR